jgi:AAA domain
LSKCPIPDRKVSAVGSGDSHTMSLMDPSDLSMSTLEAGTVAGQGAGGAGAGAGVETGVGAGTGTGVESPLYSHHHGNDSDSDDGDSPPPPPPSPPPDDDSKPLNADTEPSQSILEETKKWEELGLTHRFLTVIKRSSNVSQLEAVYRAVSCAGFTLIQGPPGTGKTSTVLNILNAFHIREYDKYYRIAVDIFLGEEGVRCRRSQELGPW